MKIFLIEGRPIAIVIENLIAGSVFYTSGISEILHYIIEPVLSLVTHIVKDFTQRLEKQCQKNTLFSTCDIKSLHPNIHNNLFLTAIKY